jgi:hypothetical protein
VIIDKALIEALLDAELSVMEKRVELAQRLGDTQPVLQEPLGLALESFTEPG